MMKITLPMPPSANRYWRKTKTGRVYISAEATEYRMRVAVDTLHYPKLNGEIKLTAKFFRPQKRGDLDNRIKILLDSLQGRLFDDDKQIVEIHAFRFDDRLNPRVEVEIEEINE